MKIGPFALLPRALPTADREGQPSPAGRRFDAAKVARMAQAIREGRYVVDAGLVADKLIVSAEALLGRRPG